jgi:hypothetical protein
MSPSERAAAYLAKVPASISGHQGHKALFRAACVLVNGFALCESDAERILLGAFNQRCEPPWTEEEIRRKVAEAGKANHAKPRGYLLQPRHAPAAVPPPAAKVTHWSIVQREAPPLDPKMIS